MIDCDRSLTAPASLAKRRGKCWQADEVVDRLREDFLGKCYLCETPLLGVEVDHRDPKGAADSDGYADRAYAWTNLFPACHDCNNGRPRRRWPGGLCSPGEGVEGRLLQTHDGAPLFAARSMTDLAAVNSAKELTHLHAREKRAADDLRAAIFRQIESVQDIQLRYLALMVRDAHETDEGVELRAKLTRAVSRRAPYTMLVRSKILAEFHDLFD